MSSIHCNLQDFGTGRPAGQRRLQVGLLDLVSTAAFVGAPVLASGRIGSRPLLEMLWRVSMVLANLSLTAGGRAWTRSAAYDRLDPSEKTAVSYFLGMTQAALTTSKALGYSHLVHVDLLLRAAGRPLAGQRPDFVAIDFRGNAGSIFSATVESKGRTNGFDNVALDRAKNQALQIPAIRGLVVREAIASEAFFDASDRWTSVLRDPEHVEDPLPIGIETYLVEFYRQIIEAGREAPTWRRDGDGYTFQLPTLPVTVSVDGSIFEAYVEAEEMTLARRDETGSLVRAIAALNETTVDEAPGNFAQGIEIVIADEALAALERLAGFDDEGGFAN